VIEVAKVPMVMGLTTSGSALPLQISYTAVLERVRRYKVMTSIRRWFLGKIILK